MKNVRSLPIHIYHVFRLCHIYYFLVAESMGRCLCYLGIDI
jgi:hypothetical protein